MNTCTSDTWTEASSQRCRERLARMTDKTLQEFYNACIFLTRPQANYGEPSQTFIIQMGLAEREMERRAIVNE